jgi:hypothetical protein
VGANSTFNGTQVRGNFFNGIQVKLSKKTHLHLIPKSLRGATAAEDHRAAAHGRGGRRRTVHEDAVATPTSFFAPAAQPRTQRGSDASWGALHYRRRSWGSVPIASARSPRYVR